MDTRFSLGCVLLEGAILSQDLIGAVALLDELQTLAARGGIAIWQAGGGRGAAALVGALG
jgi:hypothetical protein